MWKAQMHVMQMIPPVKVSAIRKKILQQMLLIPVVDVKPLTSTAKHTTAPTMSTANAPQLPSMYPVPMRIAAVIQNVILSAANADILNRNPVSIQSRHSCFF